MRKVPRCLDCGTRLSEEPWAPELCPRCSLQLALEQSPVEMEVGDDPEALPTREFPSGLFSPGQILGNRFQIRSLLGRSGMGEVWRPYDLKLRVDVALKTLRAISLCEEFSTNKLSRGRFLWGSTRFHDDSRCFLCKTWPRELSDHVISDRFVSLLIVIT